MGQFEEKHFLDDMDVPVSRPFLVSQKPLPGVDAALCTLPSTVRRRVRRAAEAAVQAGLMVQCGGRSTPFQPHDKASFHGD